MHIWFSRALLGTLTLASLLLPSARATELPDELKDVQITEHAGAPVSIGDLKFRDESGQTVALKQYFHDGKPVLLTLVYYQCPNLCNLMLNGLVDGMKGLDWVPGKQFEMVTVSINPRETPELAAAKKKAYLEQYGHPEAAAGWHFLTSPSGATDAKGPARDLASQVGFGYRWDPTQQQYAHSESVFLLTPDGRISRYLYGITFRPQDLRLGLLEASSGKIGSVVDRILLFCYRYDPQTRRYSLVLTRVMQAGCGGTVAIFGGYMALFWGRQRRRPKDEEDDDDENERSPAEKGV